MLVQHQETDAALISAAQSLSTTCLDDDADGGSSRVDEETRNSARKFLRNAFDTAFDEEAPTEEPADDEERD